MAVRQGLDAYDRWQAARPILLAGGAVGVAVSGFMLWKRRRTAEAYPLYLGIMGASAAALWLGWPSSVKAPAAPGAPPTGGPGLIAWLDAKRAAYRAQDPQWAAKTWSRLRAQPDVNRAISQSPVLQAVLP